MRNFLGSNRFKYIERRTLTKETPPLLAGAAQIPKQVADGDILFDCHADMKGPSVRRDRLRSTGSGPKATPGQFLAAFASYHLLLSRWFFRHFVCPWLVLWFKLSGWSLSSFSE